MTTRMPAAAALIAIAVGCGGGDGGGDAPPADGAPVPAPRTTDLQEAVRAAGCTFRQFKSEGQTHLDSQTATFDGYKTNPPTSGTHRPPPAAEDGVYAPGNSPDPENWVHTLEHGRVIFQYAPGTPQRRIDQLETLFNEDVNGTPGYHSALMENNTDMPFAVAAVAWTRYVGCKRFTDRAFDALRAFRAAYVDKAPEFVP